MILKSIDSLDYAIAKSIEFTRSARLLKFFIIGIYTYTFKDLMYS